MSRHHRTSLYQRFPRSKAVVEYEPPCNRHGSHLLARSPHGEQVASGYVAHAYDFVSEQVVRTCRISMTGEVVV